MAGAESGCSFEWDGSSNLYFHASSGFYHDPSAGWYYSSRDGLYYAFENGGYVPLAFDEDAEAQALVQQGEPIEVQPCESENVTSDDIEIQQPSERFEEETLIDLCISEKRKMVGVEGEGVRESCCSFEWDEKSKLYFHASSGFYHDPPAGWYYSSRDGLYYTYDNGSYVPLASDEAAKSEIHQSEPIEDQPCKSENVTNDGIEIQRPSEWLEETLINLYLLGYCNSEVTSEGSLALQTSEEDQSQFPGEESDKLSCSRVQQVEDELIPEDMQGIERSKDASSDEENWLAQYGQVVRAMDECVLPFPIIDIWDWEMSTEITKDGNQVAKLTGKLAARSTKLHPSVPSGGGRLKTASICDVHLDLVRVASGKIYRLRSPSRKYLSSLSAYDSSNPTKEWGFPNVSIDMLKVALDSINQTSRSNCSNPVIHEESNATHRQNSLPYRDRAAERRTLHGEFSIGPGQRKIFNGDPYTEESTPPTCNGEEAAAEAMNLTFGQGSYARKLLERMGWKDGEALGYSNKGICCMDITSAGLQ